MAVNKKQEISAYCSTVERTSMDYHWLDPLAGGGTFSLPAAPLLFFARLFCGALVARVLYNSGVTISNVPRFRFFRDMGGVGEQ